MKREKCMKWMNNQENKIQDYIKINMFNRLMVIQKVNLHHLQSMLMDRLNENSKVKVQINKLIQKIKALQDVSIKPAVRG